MLLKRYLLEGGLTSHKHENIPDGLGKSRTNPRWGYSLVAHVVFIASFSLNSRLLTNSSIMGGELQLMEVQMDASDIMNMLRDLLRHNVDLKYSDPYLGGALHIDLDCIRENS